MAMSKLRMPEPYIGSVSPESASYQASDDANTLARAHTILRNPARIKGLQVHLEGLKNLMGNAGKMKKVPIKGVGIRTIGSK